LVKNTRILKNTIGLYGQVGLIGLTHRGFFILFYGCRCVNLKYIFWQMQVKKRDFFHF